jgi:hypothetical protein
LLQRGRRGRTPLADEIDDSCEIAGCGFGLGIEPLDGYLGQPVALQVSECVVAGDDLVACAVGEPGAVLAVERVQASHDLRTAKALHAERAAIAFTTGV